MDACSDCYKILIPCPKFDIANFGFCHSYRIVQILLCQNLDLKRSRTANETSLLKILSLLRFIGRSKFWHSEFPCLMEIHDKRKASIKVIAVVFFG